MLTVPSELTSPQDVEPVQVGRYKRERIKFFGIDKGLKFPVGSYTPKENQAPQARQGGPPSVLASKWARYHTA